MRGSLRDHDYGPVTDPLPIILAARQVGDPPTATIWARLKRRIADHRMQRFRTVPTARRAWFVTLTSIDVDEAQFEPGQLVRGIEFRPQQFWVHARRVARKFAVADSAAGGSPSMWATEYRLCKVCGRILLAAAAREYRERERWPAKTWQYPQGPACGVECKPVIIRNSKNRKREDFA